MAPSDPAPGGDRAAAGRTPGTVPGKKRARHKRLTRIAAAFTVVAIVAFGGFLAIAGSKLLHRPSPAERQVEGCVTFLDGIAGQVRKFEVRKGRLPERLAEIQSPDSDVLYDDWDCWHKPIDYQVLDEDKRTFQLRSMGPDRLPDTPDDILWPSEVRWRK